MATNSHNLYLTKKKTLWCLKCKRAVNLGEIYVAETENHKGTCFKCSPFKNYTLLPPGDAALTRRSKKHSTLCGVLFYWNQRRKRFDRKGQYVEDEAIQKAKIECEADKNTRAVKNAQAAKIRAVKDKIYIQEFSKAIRARYPSLPKNREEAIANHACEKYSGRVGRTATAKEFDANMIDLAVEAHVRHCETNYDQEFGKGKKKREIRSDLKFEIKQVLMKWRSTID